MVIKSIANSAFEKRPDGFETLYRPYTEMAQIQQAIDFVLSYEITGICTVGDPRVLPLVMEACNHFSPLDIIKREEMIRKSYNKDLLFPLT